MANSEDYLDGLLDSISEAKSNVERSERQSRIDREERLSRINGLSADDDFMTAYGFNQYRPEKVSRRNLRKAFSESDFLSEFEDELELEDATDFLREFEQELFADEGVDASEWNAARDKEAAEKKRTDDLDVLNLNRVVEDATTEDEQAEAIEEDAPAPQEEPVAEESPAAEEASETDAPVDDDLMAGLGQIMEEVAPEEEPILPSTEEEQGEALLEDLTSILNDSDTDTAEESNESFSPDEMDAADGVTPEAGAEGEASENPEAPEESEESGESGADAPGIGEDGELDLAALLDAADAADNGEEGGEASDTEAPSEEAPSGGGGASSAPAAPANAEEEEEEGGGGLLSKLLGIFKKKKKGDDEESESETQDGESDEIDAVLAAVGDMDGAVEEAPQKSKKELKKEEKERKKKEKAEAKKEKAKAKKEKPKKEKKPKEKKPKKPKEPDTSPRIPIKVLLLFLLLSASMVALVILGQKFLSYPMQISAARSAYDQGNYIEAYAAISGVTVKEEDTLMAARIESLGILENKFMQYEEALKREDYLSALDALIIGHQYYVDHEKEASDLDIGLPFKEIGVTFGAPLMDQFGVSEERATELYELRSREDYTKQLYKILEEQGLWERR